MFFHHFFHHRKDTGLLGKGCTCSPKKSGVKGHLGVIWGLWTLIVKICIIDYCINIQLYIACKCIGLDWSKKYQNFLSTLSVMAFKQCQKLLKNHFCKFILPSEKGLAGAPKRLKPRASGASPLDPHQGPLSGPLDPTPWGAMLRSWMALLITRLVNISGFFFFFFFFLQWAILMPDICMPIALILDSLW